MKTSEIITGKIVEMLKKGSIPWKKMWACGIAKNMVSKKAYRGINALLLANSPDEYFMTYNQAKSLGGNIKKGEHGYPVVFWKFMDKVDADGNRSKFPLLRYYTVFGISQTEGIKAPAKENAKSQNERIADAEKVFSNMPNAPRMEASGKAAYSPDRDAVMMPLLKNFVNAESYYAVLFHELTHSTGHEKRLNRFSEEGAKGAAFGSKDYSKEELVAELGAAFLCAELGISSEGLLENSAGYIQGWLKALENDSDMIIRASSKARKAVDYITGKTEKENESAE